MEQRRDCEQFPDCEARLKAKSSVKCVKIQVGSKWQTLTFKQQCREDGGSKNDHCRGKKRVGSMLRLRLPNRIDRHQYNKSKSDKRECAMEVDPLSLLKLKQPYQEG